MRGVARREALRSTPDSRGPWPSPWAVNVRLNDPIDRRLRGGSRPGLTKFVVDDLGTTIADMASVAVSSLSGGASQVLFVLVDGAIKTIEDGDVTAQVAYLTTESGDILTDASGNRLVVSSGTAPAAGFLLVGQQQVFAVTTSAIVKMDPKTGQVDNLLASAGSIPTGCTFGAIYRDRLCLSGQDNAIYMSRQGNYRDWDYGAPLDDSGRAIAFQISLGADVGPLPTAMIPHKDTNLLVASQKSLWVVSGDPAADGTLRRISENVGIISSRAWCRIEDAICFLADDGIYRVNADGSSMESMSVQVIPDELRNIDTSTVAVSMGYEHDRRAVHIFLRTAGGSDTHWVYELVTESWWAVRLQNNHSPLVCCQHQGRLLLAGNDGYIRRVGGDDDDGSAIESHVVIGPLRMGAKGSFGRILNMHASLAIGSGTVNWRIVTGSTAEEAADNAKLAVEAFQAGGNYSAYVQASGSWMEGRAIMSYPRARGVWCCLWLQSTAKWAYESCLMATVPSGRWKG